MKTMVIRKVRLQFWSFADTIFLIFILNVGKKIGRKKSIKFEYGRDESGISGRSHLEFLNLVIMKSSFISVSQLN